MALHRMGPPESLIRALHAQTPFCEFVETGTYLGNTAAWAADIFDRVTTIELSAKYHAAALARFQSQQNVRAMRGYSAATLREILPALGSPVLFWLDAHWSGLDTAGHEKECPLLEELAAINASPGAHSVLVDDARLFTMPPPLPHRAEQWPGLRETVEGLSHGSRRHVVLFDDVFVAVPVVLQKFLSTWLQENAAAPTAEFGLQDWWRKLRW
jgi:hypothetical protein